MLARVSLEIYPGERVDSRGVTLGHIYVINGHGESYEMAGGPPPGRGYNDKGGHSAGITPPGHYVLGPQEHHTTSSWPMSVIPWGAPLREADGEIQYQVRGRWITASGPQGTVTQATMQFHIRSGSQPNLSDVAASVRRAFYDQAGNLIPVWNHNDFGMWAWNLTSHGARSPYYVHTTPPNEAATAAHQRFLLTQSHGCVHIRPADRDEMMQKGYLKAGIAVDVKQYGDTRPTPKPGQVTGAAGVPRS